MAQHPRGIVVTATLVPLYAIEIPARTLHRPAKVGTNSHERQTDGCLQVRLRLSKHYLKRSRELRPSRLAVNGGCSPTLLRAVTTTLAIRSGDDFVPVVDVHRHG